MLVLERDCDYFQLRFQEQESVLVASVEGILADFGGLIQTFFSISKIYAMVGNSRVAGALPSITMPIDYGQKTLALPWHPEVVDR